MYCTGVLALSGMPTLVVSVCHAGPCVLGGSLAPAGLKSRLEAEAHTARLYSRALLLWWLSMCANMGQEGHALGV